MAGSCGRLLVVCSLVFAAPLSLRGQDTVAKRVPVLAPNLSMLRYGARLEPIRPPLLPILPRQVPVLPGTIAFQKIVAAAGIIFSGHVTAIGRTPIPSGRGPASTSVTFQVEQAIRGVEAGTSLTIHEWAGLWDGGERYRIGDRVLLFLYPPSKLGLTSPVAGSLGRFSVNSQGRIVMDDEHVTILKADPVVGGKTSIPYIDFAQSIERFSH